MHRYLLPALAGILLAISALTTAAQAETYGELHNFGLAGTGHGEFRIKSGTHAFGVDTTDNSVYVGDELKGGEYRIQKLTAGGVYVAAAVFKAPNHDGIEGIAIDPGEKRVYVLALERRGETLKIAHGQPAAGTLYAFSTEPSGEALVPAPGVSEGVLIGPGPGPGTFETQSDVPEDALLEPKGITVDPTTHDVIILGEVAEETPEEEEAHSHVALERVHSNGTLGERYVDSTGFFGPTATPNSPVVSPTGAVYVNMQQAQLDPITEASADELAQIPSNFALTTPPTPFAQLTLKGTNAFEEDPVVEFDSNEPPKDGDGLSFAPEGAGGGSEGTIYARAHIFVPTPGPGAYYPGVLAFDGADGSELGWTGGQTKQSGGDSCTIGFAGETYPSVAAGDKHTVFMLDPKSAHVVELGPEGKGCPAAEASEPIATVNGKPLSPSETISTGTPVAFSSTMTQANALSVEWNFGDGQTQTESADEFQHTEVKLIHGFVQGGELTVTETIHTDDLATPTIVKKTKISVSATAPPPTAVLEGPSEVTLGKEATFDGSASSGPNPIKTYHWVFGDGISETTETAAAKHIYTKAGVYGVKLTVTDTHELTSEPSTLTIKVNEPAPETPKGGGGGGGTGTIGAPPAAALATTTTVAPTPPGPPPVPDAGLASTSLAVSPSGTVALDVTCPAGESSCAGTVTLRTLGAVSAVVAGSRHGHAKKRKASVLTLAGGTFTVTGGQEKSVALRLSAAARTLLIHMHTLRARATIAAHDPAGQTHVTQTLITLHAPKGAGRSGKR